MKSKHIDINKAKILKDLENNGFSKTNIFFSAIDKEIIKNEVSSIFSNTLKNSNKNYNDFFKISKNNIGKHQTNAIGHSEKLDLVISNFLNNNLLVDILDRVLGKNRKINTISIRKADANSSYDGIHTDHPAMMSISILVNKQNASSPTTCVVPGTHVSPILLSDKIEKFPTNLLSFFYSSFYGDTGDVMFFFNRTWHGMKRGRGTGTVIIIGLIAEGHVNDNVIRLPSKTMYGLSFEDNNFKYINNMIDKDFNATYNNNSEEIFMNRIIFNQLHPRLSYKEVFFFILGYLLQVTRIFKNLIKIRL